jgi:hypothetical protein
MYTRFVPLDVTGCHLVSNRAVMLASGLKDDYRQIYANR